MNSKTINHLSFVQAIDPLLGGGLGFAAYAMSDALANLSGQSLLITCSDSTRVRLNSENLMTYDSRWPRKAFWGPKMFSLVQESVAVADVVHGHGFYTALNWVAGNCARKQGKAFVYHSHGILDPWILNRSKFKKRVAHLLFEDANFKYAKLWRALTVKEAQQIRDFGIKAPIVVIPNGTDIPTRQQLDDWQAQGEEVFPRARKRMIFLGRLHPKKGLPLLLEVIASVAPEFRDWELAVFGPDEGGHLEELEAQVQRLRLSGQVTFLGSVSGDQKHAAYCSSDLFILPSHSEGLPMAIMEAAAHGLPVLQTTECNFPELVNVEGAFLCEPNFDSLQQELKLALKCSKEELSQRGERGRRLMQESYTWSSVGAHMHEACKEYCFS